jgi:hypothetical protein
VSHAPVTRGFEEFDAPSCTAPWCGCAKCREAEKNESSPGGVVVPGMAELGESGFTEPVKNESAYGADSFSRARRLPDPERSGEAFDPPRFVHAVVLEDPDRHFAQLSCELVTSKNSGRSVLVVRVTPKAVRHG